MSFRRIDLREDSQLAELTELFREGSRIDEPTQMLSHFSRWFGRRRQADLFVSMSRRGLPPGKYKVTRRITSEERTHGFPREANPWRDWDRLPVYEGGVLGEIMQLEQPQLLEDINAEDDPALGDLIRPMRTAMAIPTYDDGEALNWAVSFFEDAIARDGDFLRSAMLDINLLGMSTKNLVSKRQVESLNAQLTSQLERIAGIQRSLLPQKLPKIPGLEIAASYLTSDEAGGDYYDFFQLPGGQWGILIADVAGHGAPAATVMAMLRGILHCYERQDFSPAAVMDFANAKLLQANLLGTFVTAFFAVYDPAIGTLDYARCGHNPPRVRRASGDIVQLDADAGLPLGIDESLGVHTAAFKLGAGDTLVLYTDGITEAFGPQRTMFGTERLDRAIQTCDGRPQCALDSIHSALYGHVGVMERDDDQTLVVIRRTAEGSIEPTLSREEAAA